MGAGETQSAGHDIGDTQGLSPWVRGKRFDHVRYAALLGSIPVGAGETCSLSLWVEDRWVYPRGCGGNHKRSWKDDETRGLSPWVRGKQPPDRAFRRRGGSIPVGAGETPSKTSSCMRNWVYPRGCGGNMARDFGTVLGNGLSPWVRGKLGLLTVLCLCGGSIPVGAGETDNNLASLDVSGVYPRGCGGNPVRSYAFSDDEGLSPWVRGKRISCVPRAQDRGSIPVGAGETPRRCASGIDPRVYPRGCGGNLSPRGV